MVFVLTPSLCRVQVDMRAASVTRRIFWLHPGDQERHTPQQSTGSDQAVDLTKRHLSGSPDENGSTPASVGNVY